MMIKISIIDRWEGNRLFKADKIVWDIGNIRIRFVIDRRTNRKAMSPFLKKKHILQPSRSNNIASELQKQQTILFVHWTWSIYRLNAFGTSIAIYVYQIFIGCI